MGGAYFGFNKKMKAGPEIQERIEVLQGSDSIIKTFLKIFDDAEDKWDYCGDIESLYTILANELTKKALLDAKRKGIRLRFVTDVAKGNVQYFKDELMNIAEARHLDGVKGNFSISNTEYISAHTPNNNNSSIPVPANTNFQGSTLRYAIYSNVRQDILQQQYIFDTLWNKAVPVEQKIREIEKGIEPEYFEVFTDRDRERVSQILLDLAKSVRTEALILLPNAKSLVRVDRLGVIDHIIAASRNGATVKIICPASEENSEIIRKVAEQASAVRVLNGNNTSYGMYIVDRKKFLKADVKEPKAETFSEAIGFAVYSNSKPTVLSYLSIFESLWQQTELYLHLKEVNTQLEYANEQLLATEKAKEEFISMISHELKTPIVPLKGYAQMLLRPKFMGGAEVNERQKNAIEAMSRNIEKLQTLVDDVMDVYKLDMGKLKFTMTDMDIKKLVGETISELKPLTLDKKIDLKADIKINGTVFCDPNRIEQVLSNLIENSIDFVPDNGNGTITVRVQKGYIDVKESKNRNIDSNMTLFTVEDNGIGVNPEKADMLFQKFYQIDTGPTRKHAGTGLGLVICRGIIEAHGGKIWLDKTYRGGAAIKFTIPKQRKQVWMEDVWE